VDEAYNTIENIDWRKGGQLLGDKREIDECDWALEVRLGLGLAVH